MAVVVWRSGLSVEVGGRSNLFNNFRDVAEGGDGRSDSRRTAVGPDVFAKVLVEQSLRSVVDV